MNSTKLPEPKACLGPHSVTQSPSYQAPPRSWDTHFHVFGPPETFPYASDRKYTPPAATLDQYLEVMRALGIERAVCVQPNLHGTDNRVTLDAIARSDGRILGIAKIDRTATLQSLRDLHGAGVRGVRFAFNPEHGGEFEEELFTKVLGWAGELNWCVDLHLAPHDLAPLSELLSRATAPIVIDHMARIAPKQGLEQEPLRILLQLVKLQHIWIKLSGADRITQIGAPYSDVVPLARKIIEAAPERVIWGSDWPHSAYFDADRVPNDGLLFNALSEFAPTESMRKKILADNPARLFAT